MILPVAKLGALLLKTLGKPLASRLKAEAARHPRFRQMIIDFAQVRATYLSSRQLPAESSLIGVQIPEHFAPNCQKVKALCRKDAPTIRWNLHLLPFL